MGGQTRYMALVVRRRPNFGDSSSNYFDFFVGDESSALRDDVNIVGTTANPTPIVAGNSYLVKIGASGKVLVNGVAGTQLYWRSSPYYWGTGSRTGWFNFFTAANKTLFVGASHTFTKYGMVDVNNLYYWPVDLSDAQVLSLYNAGESADPRRRGLGTPTHMYAFEDALIDYEGSEPLTGYTIGSGNYSAP